MKEIVHLIEDDLGLRRVNAASDLCPEWLDWADGQFALDLAAYLARRNEFRTFLRERGDEAPI